MTSAEKRVTMPYFIDAFCSPGHTMASENSLPPGFQDMLEFGLIEALMGRRARRFFMGAEIPDGVLAYKSRHKPLPLSELEKLLVVTACGGNTGWHHAQNSTRRICRTTPALPAVVHFRPQPVFTRATLSSPMTRVSISSTIATLQP